MPSIITETSISIFGPKALQQISFSDITKLLMVRDPNSADWIGQVHRKGSFWVACAVGSYFHVKDQLEDLAKRAAKIGNELKVEEDKSLPTS
jgi:hypothetical protein